MQNNTRASCIRQLVRGVAVWLSIVCRCPCVAEYIQYIRLQRLARCRRGLPDLRAFFLRRAYHDIVTGSVILDIGLYMCATRHIITPLVIIHQLAIQVNWHFEQSKTVNVVYSANLQVNVYVLYYNHTERRRPGAIKRSEKKCYTTGLKKSLTRNGARTDKYISLMSYTRSTKKPLSYPRKIY